MRPLAVLLLLCSCGPLPPEVPDENDSRYVLDITSLTSPECTHDWPLLLVATNASDEPICFGDEGQWSMFYQGLDSDWGGGAGGGIGSGCGLFPQPKITHCLEPGESLYEERTIHLPHRGRQQVELGFGFPPVDERGERTWQANYQFTGMIEVEVACATEYFEGRAEGARWKELGYERDEELEE